MARVIWEFEALRSLDLISAYIEQFDPDAAGRMGQRLRQAADGLCEFPYVGRLWRDDIRELVTVPPYKIRYLVDGDTVRILTIRHGRQSDPD